MRLITVVVLIASLTQGALGQVTPGPKGYRMRMKYTKNRSVSYGLSIGIKISQDPKTKPLVVLGPMKLKVTGGTPNIADMEYSAGPFSSGGKQLVAKESAVFRQDEYGKPVGSGAGAGAASISLPTGPVKLGDSWKGDAFVNGGLMTGASKVKATYKLIRMEKLGGVPVARISVKFAGGDKAKISGGGTSWISIADGWLFRADTKFTITAGDSVFTATATVNRKES